MRKSAALADARSEHPHREESPVEKLGDLPLSPGKRMPSDYALVPRTLLKGMTTSHRPQCEKQYVRDYAYASSGHLFGPRGSLSLQILRARIGSGRATGIPPDPYFAPLARALLSTRGRHVRCRGRPGRFPCQVPIYGRSSTFSWGWGLPTVGCLCKALPDMEKVLRPTGVWHEGILKLLVPSESKAIDRTRSRRGKRPWLSAPQRCRRRGAACV